MKKYNQPIELIVKQPATVLQSSSAQRDLNNAFKKAGIETEFISDKQPEVLKTRSFGRSLETENVNVVLKTKAKDTDVNPWDMAHLSFDSLGKNAGYVEPNFINEFVVDKVVDTPDAMSLTRSFGKKQSKEDFNPDWQPHSNSIWHLGDKFSQLKSARDSVANIDYNVRIGHLDTGYSKTHFAIPDSIRKNPLQRNFVNGENPNDAHDPLNDGFLDQPGHGTGTMGILAGTKIDIETDNGRFRDFLGGAYFAEVVSCRIAESVILFKTNAFAEALNYLTQLTLSGTPIHVVSMSMGGAPSQVWADAVNAAYDAGITIVTASGNNFAGLPTRHVVYPARFGRVIAACGVTNDYKPYFTRKKKEMQGCYGPERHMDKALSAFTPNTPWASVESGTIRFSGAGTSSATPQIAAAAAIYYRKYHNELDQLEPWQRVEAIRNALYQSAIKKVNDKKYDSKFAEYFGNGIIRASDALKIPVATNLAKTAEDQVPRFPILNTIFRALPDEGEGVRLDMFNTELSQLVYNSPELSAIIYNDAKEYDRISNKKWNQFKEAVIHHPSTSETLKKYLIRNSFSK